MPPALDESTKDRVRRLWFSGETRKNIAAECGIGEGSVTNIINEFTKGLESADYESIRELAVQLKKEGLTFTELACIYRRHNYFKKLGANEERIESLIANLLDGARSLPHEKIADLMNQLFELSKSENIPPTEMGAYINQKIEEKKRLEEEVQKSRAILDQENVDIQTIEEYKKLEDEFNKYGLSMEDPRKLISVLQTIDEIGHDPQKIVASLARIKSLKGTERRLRNNCKMWESRLARHNEVLPMCERVLSMGIRIPLVLALETAVIKKIEVDGVPKSSAPHRVMEDIENYNGLGGIKKQLYDATLQLSLMKEILGRQNDAIVALAKFRLYGITEDQILKVCRVIELNGHNLNSNYMRSNNPNLRTPPT